MYILCGRRAEKFFWPTYQRHLRIRAGRPADRCVYTHTHTHRDCWGDCLSTAVVQHSMSGVWSYNIIFHVAGRRSRSQSHKRTSLNIDGLESERESSGKLSVPKLGPAPPQSQRPAAAKFGWIKRKVGRKVNTTDRGVQHSSFFFSCYYYH
jgi:hypothetical protein